MKNIQLPWIAIIALLYTSAIASGQVGLQEDSIMVFKQSTRLDEMIEQSVEVLEMDKDFAELAEDLVDLSLKPVNLNKAKEDDLNVIPFLTPKQRRSLFDYLTAYGEVLSIFELQSIQGFDSVLIQNIRPFISISPPAHVPVPSPNNLIKFGRHNLLVRYKQVFPTSAGYEDMDTSAVNNGSYYPGSPQRYYFRYNYTWFDKIRIGFAGEKDPGEQFFRGAQPNGMDFYAAYLYLSNIGILKNLTIGNFRISFGQGLTIGSGLSLGSVPGFSTTVSMTNGIRPSLGMSEGSYLRGVATTIKIRRFEISGFASYHSRDATITLFDSASSATEAISSFTETGYHRTRLELAKRNALTELVSGGNFSFSMAPNQGFGFKIGLTGLYIKYSAIVTPKMYTYNQFVFRGQQNLNTGFDFQIRYRGMYFFGEAGRSINGGMAWLCGAMLTPDPRVGFTMIYRNYEPEYQNLFSNAFGQNSLNANERGIYLAVNAAIHPKVNLSGYLDLFTFPWLKYRVDAPTIGQEAGIMLKMQASRNVAINLRYYQKNKRNNEPAEPQQIVHKLSENLTRSFRVGMEWFPINDIVLKTRIEVKESGESDTDRPFGYLVYQDAQVKTNTILKAVTIRFALFDIPDYASRIYTNEPEVLYGYSVPAFQGRGTRTCLVVKFGIARRIDFWVRAAITRYTDRNEVGAGLDVTNGNVRAELTGQLLIKL
ncbi:MAG: helix-hairpin-helix domain-containing protein [Bacteroidales bacterium]|nr:helix-hairpin-helix domain-containing protein [Bacteroidales bacterium]